MPECTQWTAIAPAETTWTTIEPVVVCTVPDADTDGLLDFDAIEGNPLI